MKLPLFCIIVLIFTCCKNKSETSDLELKNNLIPNTKVVVHFVNKNDTMKIGFESKILQYQHFALEDFPIMNIPKIKTSKNENVETWSFYLEVPQIINLGYNTFYVEPNDSIDITYENIGIDKFKSPIEKIVFNTPNSFIFWHNNLELTFF